MTAATTDQPTRRRFTVAEYHRMVEVGLLHPKDKVELINGEILHMSPIGPRHHGIVSRLNHHFSTLHSQVVVFIQGPVRLDDHGEPEPDVTLLKPRADFHDTELPRSEDVLLLIEVSDSSLTFDLSVKLSYYASHGICEVWIIDVSRRIVHVCRTPVGDSYQDVTQAQGNDEIAPQAFPDFKATVRDMIG